MKPGEIVYLKSGGPAMTVDQVMDAAVSCKWFNGTTVSQANFPLEALTSEDPAPAIEVSRQAAMTAAQQKAAS